MKIFDMIGRAYRYCCKIENKVAHRVRLAPKPQMLVLRPKEAINYTLQPYGTAWVKNNTGKSPMCIYVESDLVNVSAINITKTEYCIESKSKLVQVSNTGRVPCKLVVEVEE